MATRSTRRGRDQSVVGCEDLPLGVSQLDDDSHERSLHFAVGSLPAVDLT